MNKKIIITIIIISIAIIACLGFAVYYFLFYVPPSSTGGTIIKNPITNLTDQQALEQFDESFVRYLLLSIGAQNLHNPPLSSDTPKIKVIVSDVVYNAEIKDKALIVKKGEITNPDIIIRTSTQEAVKMLRNKAYVTSSFKLGLSLIELKAEKSKLLTKGYYIIYDSLS